MKLKKLFAMMVCSSALMGALAGCGAKEEPSANDKRPVAEITMEDGKTITIALYPEIAPISVENFVKLAESGFYDGSEFHRIVPGFVIQGGINETKQADTIKGEFLANGVENPLKHTRGVLSMARLSGDNDSASSQFFIVLEDAPHLDGQYAAFGEVTQGMDTVDAIAAVPTGAMDAPLDPPVMKHVKISYETAE